MREISILLENNKYNKHFNFYLTNIKTIKECFDNINGTYVINIKNDNINNKNDICQKSKILHIDIFNHRGC
jgi:hypothetical protein